MIERELPDDDAFRERVAARRERAAAIPQEERTVLDEAAADPELDVLMFEAWAEWLRERSAAGDPRLDCEHPYTAPEGATKMCHYCIGVAKEATESGELAPFVARARQRREKGHSGR